VGHTARAGKEGYALSLLGAKELKYYQEMITKLDLTSKAGELKTLKQLNLNTTDTLKNFLITGLLNKNTVKKQVKAIDKNTELFNTNDKSALEVFYLDKTFKGYEILGKLSNLSK
jgi:superfamily II DNA/RNA helicase